MTCTIRFLKLHLFGRLWLLGFGDGHGLIFDEILGRRIPFTVRVDAPLLTPIEILGGRSPHT